MTLSNDQRSQALERFPPNSVNLIEKAYDYLYKTPSKSIYDKVPEVRAALNPVSKFIGPKDIRYFKTVISHLMTSPPNSQAKLLFNLCIRRYPSTVYKKLLYLLKSPRLKEREMAATMLRDLFKQTNKPFWNSLCELNRSRLKNRLLKCSAKEENKPIIKILADTISELAADNGWPELTNLMLVRVAKNDFWSKESALLIFARLAGDSLLPQITRLRRVFKRFLGNVGSADVRIAPLFAAVCTCLKSSSDRDMFRDLLPGMMQSLEIKVLNDGDEATAQEDLNNGDETLNSLIEFGKEDPRFFGRHLAVVVENMLRIAEATAQEVLNYGDEATAQEVLNDGDEALNLLIELAKTDPRFFRRHLAVVVEGMLRIAEAESLQARTRHLAIEFLITLAEARERSRGMMRDLSQLIISRLFAILMRMLLDIKDEAAWHLAETSCLSNYSVAQECLHRVATALGGNTIIPVANDQLPAYLTSPRWQKRLAGLVALAQIAKGCSKVEILNLEQVVRMVLNSFQDPRPRVRWAAINAISELSTYVDPSLLDKYLETLLASARDDVNPQVQARAVSAVLHFSSHSPGLDGIILKKLIKLPPTDRIIRVLKLANSLEKSTDVEKRASAVLLRKMFEKPLAAPLDLVQRKLLTCLKNEGDRIVKIHLCHTIATFFNVLCIKTGWPELFDSIARWALGDKDLLEAAILILGLTRDVDVDLVRTMTQVLTKGLNRGCSVINTCKKPRFFLNPPGLEKVCSLFCIIFRKCTWSNCAPATTTQEAMTQEATTQEATTQEALKLLIKWAHQMSESDDMELLRQFVSSAIEIAQSQSLKKETRHLAIEFVITLGEGRLSNRELMIDELFEILMWDIENEAASHWESRNFSVVREFLHRLAFKLDENSVAWPVLKRYLAETKWQKRVAAIVALAPISNVLKMLHMQVRLDATSQLSTDLDPLQYIQALAEAIYRDLHPRVRLAAIDASKQLSTNYPEWYHVFVLPALGEAISDFEYPQVQDDAAFAMIDISRIYPEDTLPFLRETLLELQRLEDIGWDQTRIHEIRNVLEML